MIILVTDHKSLDHSNNIFTLTEERWGFMVSIHVLVNGDTFPLEMLGPNAVASPEMTIRHGDLMIWTMPFLDFNKKLRFKT